MPTEIFTIQRRRGWESMDTIIVQIECDPLSSAFVKLGLAVKAAFTSGANLSRANLSGANLSRADLSGANLSGAEVRGEPIKQLFASVSRINDHYVFHAFELEAGGVKVLAGCRWFTVEEYAAHVAEEYADEPKGVETLNILDFIQERAKALGIALVVPVSEAA